MSGVIILRLRNIKRAKDVIKQSDTVLKSKNEVDNFFKKKGSYFIEIGMGKGSFIIENAFNYPKNNYIGIEKYESVALRAVEKMIDLEKNQADFSNLKFLCLDAGFLLEYFEEQSIDGIYLNFSDPWPKNRQANRRLTSDFYMNIYKKILKKGGFIEQKTDNIFLFDYSVSQYANHGFKTEYISYDLYSDDELCKNNIATEYERKFHALGNKIFKIRVTNI